MSEVLWRILCRPDRLSYLIMNIAGIIFIFLGWFLDELYSGNSWLMITGAALWMIGEWQLLRSLKDEIGFYKESCKETK